MERSWSEDAARSSSAFDRGWRYSAQTSPVRGEVSARDSSSRPRLAGCSQACTMGSGLNAGAAGACSGALAPRGLRGSASASTLMAMRIATPQTSRNARKKYRSSLTTG